MSTQEEIINAAINSIGPIEITDYKCKRCKSITNNFCINCNKSCCDKCIYHEKYCNKCYILKLSLKYIKNNNSLTRQNTEIFDDY